MLLAEPFCIAIINSRMVFFDAFEEIVTKCDSFIGGNVVYMKGEEERL
ncbi:MAG: hypothetical protein J7K47_03615 [Thermoplasmata archaeon]|nr:hypothetical protein [Thermoplasmata archaeon]